MSSEEIVLAVAGKREPAVRSRVRVRVRDRARFAVPTPARYPAVTVRCVLDPRAPGRLPARARDRVSQRQLHGHDGAGEDHSLSSSTSLRSSAQPATSTWSTSVSRTIFYVRVTPSIS